MGKITALISIAALAGLGIYIGKKVIEKRNAEERWLGLTINVSMKLMSS